MLCLKEVINGKITLFIDIYSQIELAEPGWFDTEEVEIIQNEKYLPVNENIKILLAEASSVFRHMIAKYLTEDGYDVITVSNGKQALELIENHDVSIIIFDIDMPLMNGYEFIEHLRRKEKFLKIPAIALTTINSKEIISKAMACGYDEVEQRIDKEHFLNLVSKLLSAGIMVK